MNDPTDTPLAHLAQRVASDDFFLSAAMTAYQDRHRLDDAGLAALLGCAVAVLPSVRLCRMPGKAGLPGALARARLPVGARAVEDGLGWPGRNDGRRAVAGWLRRH